MFVSALCVSILSTALPHKDGKSLILILYKPLRKITSPDSFVIRRRWQQHKMKASRKSSNIGATEIINKREEEARIKFSFNHHLIRGELFATSQN